MPTTENPSLKPKPDDFLTIIRRQQLGKLKVYLGACAGVGKTYQMLIEGNRLRRQGVDAVIGYVEPHDRPETTAQMVLLDPRTRRGSIGLLLFLKRGPQGTTSEKQHACAD